MRHFVFFLIFSLVVFQQAQAQENILDTYVAEGLASNLSLKQENISLERNMRALEEARGLFMPSLELNARYSRATGGRLIEFPIGDLLNPAYNTLNQLTDSKQFPTLENAAIPFLRPEEHETKLRLVQPILQPSIYYNYQIRQTQVSMQQDAVDIYKRQLIADIRTSYYNYLKSVKGIQLYEKVKSLQLQNLALNEKLFENNKITYDAIYAIKADISDTELKLADAGKNKTIATAYFNFLLNKPLDTRIQTDTTFAFEEITAFGMDDLLTTSLEKREEIQQVNKGLQITEQNLKLNRSKVLPTLNLVVDYGFQGTKYRFTSQDDYLQGSLVLSWQLFGGFQNRSRIAQASLDRQRLETQQTELQQRIRLQVTTAAEQVRVARQNVQTATERVTSAQKYFNIVNRKYKEGMALYIEYLSALTSLTNAENSKILAEYDYQIRITELNRVAAKD
ncbi:TolC family protein [Rhodocytophaga rosea]|uniref:TolC family protein n=1 Tax=Rhodocytophaga rosea TaxID=2704465 RepID=A0A6C0GK56_9BACT|nr:TolC family protein [Rhodocytophaga rosea]QHT68408.1 TolC family protein [Rhodocytophaga rosea]